MENSCLLHRIAAPRALLGLLVVCTLLASCVNSCMQAKSEKIQFENFNKSIDALQLSLQSRKTLLRDLQIIKAKLKHTVIAGSCYFGTNFLCDTTMEMMATTAGGTPEDLTANAEALDDLHEDAQTLISYTSSVYSLTCAWYKTHNMLAANEAEINNHVQQLTAIANELDRLPTINKSSMKRSLSNWQKKINQLNIHSLDPRVDNQIKQLFGRLQSRIQDQR